MVFSSNIFLFIFLPIVILGYYFVCSKFRNYFLLLSSLFFYFIGEGLYTSIMLISITINYAGGYVLGYFKEKNKESYTVTLVLLITVCLNLGLLIYFKYFNFIADSIFSFLKIFNIQTVQSVNLNKVHLPIGISFFTFQALSYVIDVYRGEVSYQKNIFKIGLYITLFPQLIAGPIIRYINVAKQIDNRIVTIKQIGSGFKRFAIGLSKKVIIANTMSGIVDKIFALEPGSLTAPIAWFGILCYTLQIYFDFSGYSDMAIGLGRIFGFHFLENFNYPYVSKSIREFWRRWHISLSTWFRDYLYIPLGGNRKGRIINYFNLLIVFTLCGLWHGASWTFLVWGLWFGLFLVLERTQFAELLSKAPYLFQHLYVLLVVMVSWVFFRSDNLGYSIQYLKTMAGFSNADYRINPLISFLNNEVILIVLIGVIISFPLYRRLLKIRTKLLKKLFHKKIVSGEIIVIGTESAWFIFIFVYSIVLLSSGSYNPFIYFRF